MPVKPLYAYRCSKCGGDHCGHDAYARFDIYSQAWELGGTYDNTWCNDCGEVALVRVALGADSAAAVRAERRAEQRRQRLLKTASELLALFDRLLRVCDSGDPAHAEFLDRAADRLELLLELRPTIRRLRYRVRAAAASDRAIDA